MIWDDLWYEPVHQYFDWRISVDSISISDFSFPSITSVSSYHLIAFWIAFSIIFVWMINLRIFDWSLKCQSIKSLYIFPRLFERICLLFGTFVFFLGVLVVTRDWMKLSIVTLFLFCLCHYCTDCLSKLLIGQWYIVTVIMVNCSFQHICIVFFFLGGHACSFICHVKSVHKHFTTLEYVKIAQKLIHKWRFLILCIILCVFLFVYIFVNELWLVLLWRTFSTIMIFDSS